MQPAWLHETTQTKIDSSNPWLHLGLKESILKPLVSSESGFLQPCWLHLGLNEATLKPFETTGFIWAWFHATLLVAFGIERGNFGNCFLALWRYLCYILVPGALHCIYAFLNKTNIPKKHFRDEKVKKKKNKKSYLKKLIGLRRMGTAESGYWVSDITY